VPWFIVPAKTGRRRLSAWGTKQPMLHRGFHAHVGTTATGALIVCHLPMEVYGLAVGIAIVFGFFFVEVPATVS
jgi:hypothetical protein